jgi:hypothetical protein
MSEGAARRKEDAMENLKDRLALEAELLDRIERDRETPGCEEISSNLEREIIDRELAELARAAEPEPVLVRRRRASR